MTSRQVILTVNGERVPPELIQAERSRLAALEGWDTIEDASERGALLTQASEKSAIDRVLLHQEIEKDKTPVDEERLRVEMERLQAMNGCRTSMTENLMASVEVALRQERVLRTIAGMPPRPSRQDVRAFYEANLQRFQLPEEVHAAHVVIHVDEKRSGEEALPAIEAALSDLEAGQPFPAVADFHSDCKGKGGDLGFFRRGVMLEEFDNVVFALEPGERSGIFRTGFGFHIAEVRARRPARFVAFDEVAAELESTLTGLLDQRAMEKAFDRIRERAVVERAEIERPAA